MNTAMGIGKNGTEEYFAAAQLYDFFRLFRLFRRIGPEDPAVHLGLAFVGEAPSPEPSNTARSVLGWRQAYT
jgi:hypothetical protein